MKYYELINGTWIPYDKKSVFFQSSLQVLVPNSDPPEYIDQLPATYPMEVVPEDFWNASRKKASTVTVPFDYLTQIRSGLEVLADGTVGYIVRDMTVEELAADYTTRFQELSQFKHEEIKNALISSMKNGAVDTGLGWVIDARRDGTASLDDIQNMEGLLKIAKIYGLTTVDITGADNIEYSCTVADLENVVIPTMINYGLSLYVKKRTLRDMINSATTIEELNQINW